MYVVNSSLNHYTNNVLQIFVSIMHKPVLNLNVCHMINEKNKICQNNVHFVNKL